MRVNFCLARVFEKTHLTEDCCGYSQVVGFGKAFIVELFLMTMVWQNFKYSATKQITSFGVVRK